MFVLRPLPSKLDKIAFARWKFQEKQAFQVLGCFVVNASKERFLMLGLAALLCKIGSLR